MRKLLIAATLMLLPSVGSAQRVFGRVIDAGSSKPVVNVEVRLSSRDGPLARAVTDSAGRFLLRTNEAGTYQISTNHISYAPVTAGIELTAGNQVEVVLRVSEAATELPAIEVIARTRAPDAFLERSGFYERKASGFGLFRTPEEIERRKPYATTDLFQGVSGVRVFYAGIRGKDIRISRAEDPNCPPRVYVDGVIVRPGGRTSRTDDAPLDALLGPHDIIGLELYRSPAETPTQFGGNQVTCGVVVFWTRRGSAR
ncbi:MAG: carboxypeptidase regulatory-like domain-containing protein [Gemmatimonadota bacterium]